MASSIKNIKIAIVEKDLGYRVALQAIINTAGQMQCAGAFSSVRKALPKIAATAPDVVLLGLASKGNGTGTLVRQLVQRCPSARVIVLGWSEDSQSVLDALSSGALGYLLHTDSWPEICMRIREVYRGGSAFSPVVAIKVVKLFRSMADPVIPERLSIREQDIMQLLAERSRNKEIALALNLSVPTVRSHLRTIYVKLRVRSRSEAIRKTKDSIRAQQQLALPPAIRQGSEGMGVSPEAAVASE